MKRKLFSAHTLPQALLKLCFMVQMGFGCTSGTCSWPIFVGDGNQGSVEVQSMDVDSSETSIVIGLKSTDTTLTGSAQNAV